MSQTNLPAGRAGEERQPMNASGLKTAVPLALLMGVIFAVTYFSIYTKDVDEKTDKKEAGPSREKPLRFFTTTRRWDPFASESLQDRAFQGFYEAGETQQVAHFWFENRNTAPVALQLKGVSCSACSGGRVAPIPAEEAQQLFQSVAVSCLPLGPLSGTPTVMGGAAAHLFAGLQWQSHSFNKSPSEVVYNIPAAPGDTAEKWAPKSQWGILELNFKVRENPNVPLQAAFTSQVQGTEQIGQDSFSIYFERAHPFEVEPMAIEVGTLIDSSQVQNHEILLYSSTRTPAELGDLTVRVLMPPALNGEPGEFVAAGKPVPLTDEEMGHLVLALSAKRKAPTRVQAAFRIPVTVRPRVGDARPDIGRFERDVWVSVAGAEPKRVVVKGVVRGPVYLSTGTEIQLQPFPYESGTTERFEVTTDRPGIELALVSDQTRPKFLQVALKKLPDRGDRGYYEVEVKVPPKEQLGTISDGVIVLEVKGPNGQRIRIPVQGRGTK